MNKDDVWNLFSKTGKIEYYLKYKEMLEKKADNLGNSEVRGNYNK